MFFILGFKTFCIRKFNVSYNDRLVIIYNLYIKFKLFIFFKVFLCFFLFYNGKKKYIEKLDKYWIVFCMEVIYYLREILLIYFKSCLKSF